jgi:hypothetical protein
MPNMLKYGPLSDSKQHQQHCNFVIDFSRFKQQKIHLLFSVVEARPGGEAEGDETFFRSQMRSSESALPEAIKFCSVGWKARPDT